MNTSKTTQLPSAIFALLLCLSSANATSQPRMAVLDFELRDHTLAPGIPQEIARTASVKPMLEEELKKSGYDIVTIPLDAQTQATAGVGYLFDHHDVAAQLAQQYGADYVIVGRLHKPSFLFVYLMVHLIDVKQQRLIADYLSEVKGGEKKLTRKGVESLVVKVNDTFSGLK
ncbi:DUF2380 domain-containing protein [Methyloglobulus sp.]|uniref:DUF2380 domain-containing protein n=1 Tax=Methyloglobulus sp. TaxID=2518622 RepID=UPI003989E5F0